jgi:hypothetical protein
MRTIIKKLLAAHEEIELEEKFKKEIFGVLS